MADIFIRANVKTATYFDYNAKRYVCLKNRGSIGKMLRRLSRARLKNELIKEGVA